MSAVNGRSNGFEQAFKKMIRQDHAKLILRLSGIQPDINGSLPESFSDLSKDQRLDFQLVIDTVYKTGKAGADYMWRKVLAWNRGESFG